MKDPRCEPTPDDQLGHRLLAPADAAVLSGVLRTKLLDLEGVHGAVLLQNVASSLLQHRVVLLPSDGDIGAGHFAGEQHRLSLHHCLAFQLLLKEDGRGC